MDSAEMLRAFERHVTSSRNNKNSKIPLILPRGEKIHMAQQFSPSETPPTFIDRRPWMNFFRLTFPLSFALSLFFFLKIELDREKSGY
jgi:hypothetical protein